LALPERTNKTLASNTQYKVQRTLAFSVHRLALILGDDSMAVDLVPIFNGFLKDIDEVRIGVLKTCMTSCISFILTKEENIFMNFGVFGDR
jgi:hypothetical protein